MSKTQEVEKRGEKQVYIQKIQEEKKGHKMKAVEGETETQLDFKIAWYTQRNSGALNDTMLTMLLMRKLKSTLTKV